MGAVEVPEPLFGEFALATDEELLELEAATAKLRAKGLDSAAIVPRLIKAGWSDAAATWYAEVVVRSEGPVKIIVVGRKSFAPYPRLNSPDPNSPIVGIRVVAVLDLLIGIVVAISVPGLILMERRYEAEGVRLLSTFALARQGAIAILLLGTGFLLLKAGPRSSPSWLRALHVVEWLDAVMALYGIYLVGHALNRYGFRSLNFDVAVYLAFPISWFAVRGLRLYLLSLGPAS